MNSFNKEKADLPISSVWLMNAISEYKGKQELYAHQSPQILKALVELALIESAESSNRIEGIMVERNRLKPLVIGHSKPRPSGLKNERVILNLPGRQKQQL